MSETHKSNWDDLRFVLAVAEHGSVNAASRALGVNHATVLRRVAAFEEAHGSPIFERSAQGYAVFPDKMGLIGAVRDAASAMHRVSQMSRVPEGRGLSRVQVTSTDSLCTFLLPRLAPELGRTGVAMEISSSNAHLDLGRLRAEVAVRPSPKLPGDLLGTKAAELAISAFAPASGGDGRWLGLSGPLGRVSASEWMSDKALDIDVAGAADSFLALHQLVGAGAGCAFLPTFLGRNDPRLVPLDDEAPTYLVPIWVATHKDLADLPRLDKVRRTLADAIGREADWLAGQADYPGWRPGVSG